MDKVNEDYVFLIQFYYANCYNGQLKPCKNSGIFDWKQDTYIQVTALLNFCCLMPRLPKTGFLEDNTLTKKFCYGLMVNVKSTYWLQSHAKKLGYNKSYSMWRKEK